jgi:SWI/SNF-related matrix-associated actin-dependent regulator of chromatin subfamily A3
MATISLRRIKEKLLIGLPSKTVETVSLKLSGEERELYDRMESSSKDFVDYFIFADRLRSRYSFVHFLVLRLRKLCDDSALCSLDLTSLLPSDNIRGIADFFLFIFFFILVLRESLVISCGRWFL